MWVSIVHQDNKTQVDIDTPSTYNILIHTSFNLLKTLGTNNIYIDQDSQAGLDCLQFGGNSHESSTLVNLILKLSMELLTDPLPWGGHRKEWHSGRLRYLPYP